MVAAGYAVSIPPELKLANKVLLSLYTGYISISVAAVAVLWRRSRAF